MRTVIALVGTICLAAGCRADTKGGNAEPGETGAVSAADLDADGYPDDDDCDDEDPDVHPGAMEVCDGVDNDCDGAVDEDVTSTWYADDDGDGYGDPEATTEACGLPDGYATVGTDCDDGDPEVYPGALEVCDGVDNDCDGAVDEDVTSTWFEDRDGDGYGDVGATTEACDLPVGYAEAAGDCDDADASVHPGAAEVCDGIDDDCDGLTDDDDPDLDTSTASTWYADDDGDGYGDPAAPAVACAQPSGTVSDATDCDDADASVHPGAAEVCDGIDDDCDGLTDDDDPDLDTSTASTWYADDDLDGYGDASSTTLACDEPSGYTDDDSDCDDTDPDVNPGATEDCNGIDDDCDGVADSSSVCPCSVEYYSSTEAPYMFCTKAKNWEDALAFCESYDYHLLTIGDASENSWADSTADTYSTSKWWMGFNDRDVEGTWVWEDGSPVTYTNWESGEPNNLGNEDCGQLNRFHPDQTWNDEPCSYTLYFICEYD